MIAVVSSNTSFESFQSVVSAQGEFRSLVARAFFQTLFNKIIGRPTGLRAFEEARKTLGPSGTGVERLREIDLDRVIGSVGRWHEYTPSFLPRYLSDEDRWVRVKRVVNGTGGLPPLEVYQIGDDYYVEDGHHRVSVLKRLGVRRTEAWVTEVRAVHES